MAGRLAGALEGGTLVVDTRISVRETSFRGSSANTHLVERLTRVDADTLATSSPSRIPTTWTRPWTAAMFMKRIPGPLFEYACHEGNYAMFHILSGARASDKAASSVAAPRPRR